MCSFLALHHEVQLSGQIKSMPVGEELPATTIGHQEENQERKSDDGEEAELDFNATETSVEGRPVEEESDIQLSERWIIDEVIKGPIKWLMALSRLQRSWSDGKLKIDVEELARRIRINLRRLKEGDLSGEEDVWISPTL
jgi:hypothetical protein